MTPIYLFFSYACNLYDLNISTNVEIGSVNGTHLHGKNDSNVELIQFLHGKMFYIPNGIGNFFNNLKTLVIGNTTSSSIGTKAIQRINFKHLENLSEIIGYVNDMKKLDKDALWDLQNLQFYEVTGKNVKLLNVRTFERNRNLIVVAIISTSLTQIPANLFRYNFLLDSVYLEYNAIESISDRLFWTNGKLRKVSLRSNKLESLPASLFINNPLLAEVDFGENKLKVIEIDFTKLKNIKHISLEFNTCIDAKYDDTYKNLTTFQQLIKLNCSSHPENFSLESA